MRQYFGDPYDAFDRYDRDYAQEDKRAPVCLLCGERIHEEMCYVLTSSDDLEEQRERAVHRTCLRMHCSGRGAYEAFREAVGDLIEEQCYKKTPRKDEIEEGGFYEFTGIDNR